MTTLREAAQQALSALELGYDAAKSEADQYHAAMAGYKPQRHAQMDADVQQIAKAITALKAALAEPVEFDHGIGADRFKVVRGAFWWHVLIGDSTTEHGKFRTKASAEKMAADLLREFRNGAFVQHQGGGNLPLPLQEPYAWMAVGGSIWRHKTSEDDVPLYTAPTPAQGEHMSDLQTTAQLALKALESVEWYGAGSGWVVDSDAVEKSITALRAALAEPTVPSDCADSHQPGCDHCRSPLWCGTKCRNCGRKA